MAFEAVTRDWLDERTLAHDSDLLVVDKPSGVPVHGGPGAGSADLVTALKGWLVAEGRDDYLGVHHRLDQDTSGVLLFTRSRGMNRPIAEQLESHQAHKTYLAAVSGGLLAQQGVLQHRLSPLKQGRVSVVKRGGKPATTRYRVLDRAADRALVELCPETGRTHQLRVQLAHAGAPIAGDRLYGGAPAGRLMLHACELRLAAIHKQFSAPVPPQLGEWVQRGTTRVPTGRALLDMLTVSAWKRRTLIKTTDAYRLVNEMGDGLPGVVIDRYGEWAVLEISSEGALERRSELAEALLQMGARGVYAKIRVRADKRRVDQEGAAPSEPIAGESAPDPLTIREGQSHLKVRLGDGLQTGLFIDQRDNRRRVQRAAGDGRVLNLFCYTGSFSVAAVLGGAKEVVSVDLSGRALQRAKENFAASGVDPDAHQFIKEDVIGWLGRVRRRGERSESGERFNVVILDPPSFSTRGKRATFRIPADYGRVARDALHLLQPGGNLWAVTNHRKTSLGALRKLLRQAAHEAGREVVQLKDQPVQLDCPPGPDGPYPSKTVMVTVS